MAKNPYYRSFYLNPERDADIIKFLEHCESNGYTISDVIRQAIRYYAGLLSKEDSGNIDKALYRVIQLEKELNDLIRAHEEFKREIYGLLNSKVEEFAKKFEKLQNELNTIKQSYERKKKEEEEERREKEKEERKRREEELRKEVRARFEHYSECEKYGGLRLEQKFFLRRDLLNFANEFDITLKQAKKLIVEVFPNLKEILEEICHV